jgi:hypothetical protein
MHTLRAIGAEVLRLREHLPTDAPDEIVITTAQRLEAILAWIFHKKAQTSCQSLIEWEV